MLQIFPHAEFAADFPAQQRMAEQKKRAAQQMAKDVILALL